ncbi:MAG: hypothetical protein WCL29_08975, partial [Pseudomonadota bacterium]
ITVLGFSNGCWSAAHVSASVRQRWGTRLQGVAMLSCANDAFHEPWIAALDRSGNGESALAKVPVLVVHHRRDSCLLFADVEGQAKRHDFITIEDNKQPRPNMAKRDCGNGSAHQFGGKEEKTYQSVVDWIRATQVMGTGLRGSLP